MDILYRALRSKVSGDKKRYLNGVFDLDLTYITDRIIAMAFPASGMESKYRNDINEVSDMLTSEHGSHYRVYNLTERVYDYSKFGDRVAAVGWLDHHAPPLILLFKIMLDMHQWLLADPRNVCTVHCLAGKGRTGTVIVCYLLFCGLFDKYELASRYFAIKRSVNNWGVTGPSQQRYIEYMYKIITTKKPPNPFPLRLTQIIFLDCPAFTIGTTGKRGLVPVISIYDMNNGLSPRLIWQSKADRTLIHGRDLKSVWQMESDLFLWGDVNITIHHVGTFGQQHVGRFAFNTGMVSEHLVLTFTKAEIDEALSDKRVPADFKVVLIFAPAGPSEAPPRTDITPQEENEFWARVLSTERLDGRTCFWQNENLQMAIQEARATADTRVGTTVERGGWLTKQGHKVRNWKRRWFVLHSDTLEYYGNPKDSKPKGVIRLDDILSVESINPKAGYQVEMPNAFIIYTNWNDYICSADNESDQEEWVMDLLLALHLREKKKESRLAEDSFVGQLHVSVLEILHHRPSYCVIILGSQRCKTEPLCGHERRSKELVFDLYSNNHGPLLVQLWEANSLLPDEIVGEMRFLLDDLIKESRVVEVKGKYAFRRKPSEIILKLTYRPRSWLESQKQQQAADTPNNAYFALRSSANHRLQSTQNTTALSSTPTTVPLRQSTGSLPISQSKPVEVSVEDISEIADKEDTSAKQPPLADSSQQPAAPSSGSGNDLTRRDSMYRIVVARNAPMKSMGK